MDYFCFIQSVAAYIENRLKTDMDYRGLERATGFSLPHTREIFRTHRKIPLARYVVNRKVSNAAFELIHTDKSLLDIALEYGFESYDTFTRAFKRVTGKTPSEFRKGRHPVGRVKLTAGIYGPGILADGKNHSHPQLKSEESTNMKTVERSEDSCVLYGVPKVHYRYEECTPFPSCLKACLKYMGQEMSYCYIMAASGASFRLRWNTTCWDGGNVDIMCIYKNAVEAFERSFKAVGRSFKLLERKSGVEKDDFIRFIKSEIDEGRPVIALGIIGPPEACIVTGYRHGGDTLLGWNFFQDNPEFARDTETDESGYFICSNWWENPCTGAVMSVGEEAGEGSSLKEILHNAINIMTEERVGNYAGGQAAYDAWAGAMSDETQFPKDAVLPLLFERLMCQNDAMVMIGEGRAYARDFMEWIAGQRADLRDECHKAASLFNEEFTLTNPMRSLISGWQQGESQARKLAEPDVRKGIVDLILKAKQLDASACGVLKKIVEKL